MDVGEIPLNQKSIAKACGYVRRGRTELFERDARFGVALLQRVASTMAARLEQTRDRLSESAIA